MRLVLIEKNTYTVYEGKRCIAVFELDDAAPPLTAEQVEDLRLEEHKELA